MKKRTFFTTLVLFIIFMNGILFTIVSFMLKDRISNLKEWSLSEYYVIAVMMQNDMQALTDREIYSEENVLLSLQQYSDILRHQKSGVVLFDGNTVIFQNKASALAESHEIQSKVSSLEEGIRYTGFVRGKQDYFYIWGKLPEPYGQYTLLYETVISDIILEWKNFRFALFGAGSVFSLLMACCLLALMQRIFRPFTEIVKVSNEIANGQYEKRLFVKGTDELSDMAASFNHMADKIQNQIRELDQSARQKQEFIDNFGHELKTPLTAIYGYAQYLQNAAASEEERTEAADYILSECRRVQSMAKQLMDLVVLRETEFKIQSLDVKQLLGEIQMIMLPKAIEKGITIQYQYGLKYLEGDSGLMIHLLTNLISNAIVSCEKNGTITVKAFHHGNRDCIKIEDNGRGMEKEELNHITEAFYRVDKSRSRQEGGAGLGLAICSKIAEIMNIKMEFESAPGSGTKVFLFFTSL